jgi:hypothetical protein
MRVQTHIVDIALSFEVHNGIEMKTKKIRCLRFMLPRKQYQSGKDLMSTGAMRTKNGRCRLHPKRLVED